MSFLYETHLHTLPVSRCGHFSVRENLEFYKKIGYAGVFITNHFIDSPKDKRWLPTYGENIQYFFSDYEDALKIGAEIGMKVFFGAETTYGGSDFLIYGLDKMWFLAHPEIMEMKKREQLEFFMANGALVIQAHPFREAKYIDHIRLFPRSVHGVEIINACRTDFENEMAVHYVESYGLLKFAGSDNHWGAEQKRLAGMQFETPILNEQDFVTRIKNGEGEIFSFSNPLLEA
ncbi:MAG: histidinol phosphatase [Clostridia bacterium]|nr:histidinol phosphatase [Clostridia bacterium]